MFFGWMNLLDKTIKNKILYGGYTMIENLQNIINENIEWFWNNDPMLEYESNVDELWNGFKLWCVQNCMEVCEENNMPMKESFVERLVLDNFDNWLNWNK